MDVRILVINKKKTLQRSLMQPHTRACNLQPADLEELHLIFYCLPFEKVREDFFSTGSEKMVSENIASSKKPCEISL